MKIKDLHQLKLLTVSALFASSIYSSNVFAQDSLADEGKFDIEEIVVTGTKRDVSQQDLAISVSTVTDKQLENTFKNDVFALGQLLLT